VNGQDENGTTGGARVRCVFGTDGKPCAGVRVNLGDQDVATGRRTGGRSACVPTDREGRFVFPAVAPGGHTVDVGAWEPAGQATADAFELAAGAVVEIELHLAK